MSNYINSDITFEVVFELAFTSKVTIENDIIFDRGGRTGRLERKGRVSVGP